MTEQPPTLNYAPSPTIPWRDIALITLAYWTGEVAGADGITIVGTIAGGDPEATGILPMIAVQIAAMLLVGACVTGGLLSLVYRIWERRPPKHTGRYVLITAFVVSGFWTLLDILPATRGFIDNSAWIGWVAYGSVCFALPALIAMVVLRRGERII